MGRADALLGELERLFGLDAIMALAEDLIGFTPAEVGSTGSKGAFARALVQHCGAMQALDALGDAIRLRSADAELPPAEPPVLTPGTEIAGFRVLRQIGQGPRGHVYVGVRGIPDDPAQSSKRAALKVFDRIACREREVLWRFVTSVRAMRGIQCDGLARVYDAGLLPSGHVWIASEFVPGQNLAGRLGRSGAVHFHEMLPVARGVLHGLTALHNQGLLHGNLKIENIFVQHQRQEELGSKSVAHGKLVNAGHVALLGGDRDAEQLALLVGDVPQLVSPERLRGAPPSPESETYALACLLYHALAGRPPFTGATIVDVLAAQLHESPAAPSTYAPRGWISPELDEVVLRALHKDPTQRCPSAADFADALEAVGRSLSPPSPAEEQVDAEALARADWIVRNAPEDQAAATQLEALAEVGGEWQRAVDAFLAAASASPAPYAAKALLQRCARILLQEMDDPQGAEDVYRKLLALDPTDAHAQGALEELKRASQDHDGLIEVLLERLASETLPGARAAILREVASLYEEALASPNEARLAWTQLLLEDPDDPRAARSVERLTRTDAQWQETLAALQQGLAQSAHIDAQLQLAVLLGRWWDEQMARPELAIEYLAQALQLEPSHEPALDALTALYRRSHSWAPLAQLLVRRADASPSPSRGRDLRTDAAVVYLRHLDDPATAGRMLVDVVEEDPSHPTATSELHLLLREAEDWDGVATLLETCADNLLGAARCDALCELADLHMAELDDVPEAERRYNAVLKLDETYLPAVKGLNQVHRLRNNFPALAEVLQQQIALTEAPSERVRLLVELGTVLEDHLNDPVAAANRFEQILELSPGHSGANTALARLYRRLQLFDELVQTLDRHAKCSADTGEKAQLLMQAARVFMADVGSPEKALFMCQRVLGLVPEHSEALELTARIRALGGDTANAVDALEVMADTEHDPEKKAELWVRAGRYLEEAEDLEGAVERYHLALEMNPGSVTATDALRRMYARRGDAEGEAELLLREVQLCTDDAERAAKLVELGKLRLTRMNDTRLSADAFERAVALVPDQLDATTELGLLAASQQHWDKALSLLLPLEARAAELGMDRTRRVFLATGEAQQAKGDGSGALKSYLQALAIGPKHADVLDRLAKLAEQEGRHEDAVARLGQLLQEVRETSAPGEVAAVVLRLAQAQRRLGRTKEAEAALQQVCKLNPTSEEALRALSEVQEELGEWEALSRTLRTRADLSEDDSSRFELLLKVGDLFLSRIGDRHRACTAFVRAMELRPADRNVLAKLMSVYSEDEDWHRLIEVLERMASVVDEPSIKAKYLTAAGNLVQRELLDRERSAALFTRALETDPQHEAAFRGLQDGLEQDANWQGMAQATHDFIASVQQSWDAERLAPLWDKLGQVLVDKLHLVEEGVAAYQEALQLGPDDRGRLERLAEIYGKQPNRYADQAVRIHAILLQQSPYRTESYQALRRLYTQVQRADEAWCVCQALHVLNVAEPEEVAFFRRHRSTTAVRVQESVNDGLWRAHLLSPQLDPLLTAIFAMVTPAAVHLTSQNLKAFDTAKKYLLNPAKCDLRMVDMLEHASNVLLLPMPPLYQRQRDQGGLSFLYTDPPAAGLGVGARQDAPDQAVAFIAARHLSYYRPGHYMRQLVPSGAGLRSWVLAVFRLANARFPVQDSLRQQVQENHEAILRTLAGPKLQSLKSAAEQLLHNATELDTRRWATAVDLTADRAGLLVSNSLAAAMAVVRASPAESSYAPERERLRMLPLYAVSPEYLALRNALDVHLIS